MSRLMTLAARAETAPATLRSLAGRDLAHLAEYGPTPALRADAAEIAAHARAAAQRCEDDPEGFGAPGSRVMAVVFARVLYAVIAAQEAWWAARQGGTDHARAEGCVRRHLADIRAALNS